MSTQSSPLTSFDDHASWLEQVFAALGLARLHVVGHSFGGAMAAHYAHHHLGRLASLTLLEPVLVLRGLPASTYLWATLLLLPAPRVWKDRALAQLGGVSVDEIRERTPLSVMIDEAAKHYLAPRAVHPRTLTDRAWRAITASVPSRVDIAGQKSLTGGEDAAARARALGFEEVTVWARATHSLPMQMKAELDPELARWWTVHD